VFSIVSLHCPVFGMKLEKGKLEDDLTQLKLRCSTLEAELGTANAERKVV
jgi:hypothetical protein